MKDARSTTCSRRSRALGLTLIEVVAALAILGTLLVGIVLAKSRYNDQLRHARAQAGAVERADQLIARWWASPGGVPVGEEGVLPGGDRLRWRTRVVDNAEVAELGVRVVRVEIVDPVREARRDGGDETRNNGPLIVVDLVLPDPEAEQEKREEQRERQQKRGAGDA